MIKDLFYQLHQYRKGLPYLASAALTYRCTLRCRMCGYWKGGKRSREGEISEREFRDLFRDLHVELGVRRFRFIGGEPLLRPETPELVDYVKHLSGTHLNIVTDGTHLKPEVSAALVKSGLDSIRFSIDGISETHDLVRGREGTFQRMKENLLHLQELKKKHGTEKPQVEIHFCATSLNAGDLGAVKKLSQREFAPSRFMFALVSETSPRAVRETVWEGKPVASEHFIPLEESLKLKGRAREDFDRQAMREARGGYPAFLRNILKLAARRVHSDRSCPEANHFQLDPYGEVRPCAMMLGMSYGNIREIPLRDVWTGDRHVNFMKRVHRQFFPVCEEICGKEEDYYIGNMRQFARKVLTGMIPSPYR